MRDGLLWGTALLFLLCALHAVTVRREVYEIGRSLDRLESAIQETSRCNDNLEIERDRLLSPEAVRERAREAGLLPAASEDAAR